MESIYNLRRVFLNWMILSMKLLTCGICCWHFYPPWKSRSTINVVFSYIVTYKCWQSLTKLSLTRRLRQRVVPRLYWHGKIQPRLRHGGCYTDRARPKNHQEDPGPESWVSWGSSGKVAMLQPPPPRPVTRPTSDREILEEMQRGKIFLVSSVSYWWIYFEWVRFNKNMYRSQCNVEKFQQESLVINDHSL